MYFLDLVSIRYIILCLTDITFSLTLISECGITDDIDSSAVLNLDLDSFLATVTVPPPVRTASTLELTSEQINSFIIPPPPPAPIVTETIVSMELCK